ncbi:MAG: hypothetical protein OEM19_04495, partial [Deltaproteobacteria bacterium]|nr:hypothetical protein [Deltaproteobacteria bacterium]
MLYFLCCLVFGGYGFSLIWLILSEIRISKDQKGPGKRFPDKTSEDKKTRQISYARGHWVFGGCWNLLGAIIFYSQIDYLGSLRVGQILSTSIILIVGLLLLISAIHKTIRWRKSAAPSKGIDTAGVVAGMSVLDSTKQGTGINRLRLGRWLLFGGMLVAVPYYIHVKSFSGKEVGRFVLADRERMGNITFTAEGNQLTNQVGPIELGPDMNPLRVVLYVESAKRSVRFHLSYTVRMLDNNGAIV